MPTYKTPDVYVVEVPVFPPSIAEVESAIPAFVGYTEIAIRTNDDDLRNIPTKVRSFKEFEYHFGGAQIVPIKVEIRPDPDPGSATGFSAYVVANADPNKSLKFFLYYSVKMFFDNGGGQCYIVSVGDYKDSVSADLLVAGLQTVAIEDEPTLLVVPEAARLSDADFKKVVDEQLNQCQKLGDRFAIFDIPIPAEAKLEQKLDTNGLLAKRSLFGVGTDRLKHGAAYYPFVKSSINFLTKEGPDSNVEVLMPAEVEAKAQEPSKTTEPKPDTKPADAKPAGAPAKGISSKLSELANTKTAFYNLVKQELKSLYVTLPPSGAVAGAYCLTDGTRGVWKAPANISLAGVIAPVLKIDKAAQAEYNVDPTTGVSINVLRTFAGKGTLIWGARTLAGNDNEWRYVSVRRFFTMVEESVQKSTYWAVFESNDANTWVRVRGMIENYLTQKWREGALAGATPKDAFFVRCGLGSTMDAQDVLEGRLVVEIGMAAVRPAEFIILRFSHKLQTS